MGVTKIASIEGLNCIKYHNCTRVLMGIGHRLQLSNQQVIDWSIIENIPM